MTYRTKKRCLFAVNQFMIRKVLFSFERLAAILASEFCRWYVSFQMSTQKSLDEKTLAAVRTCVIVSRRLGVMLQRLEIRKRGFASSATIILFRRFLFLDGVGILMESKIGKCVENFAANVTTILGPLVALCVLKKIVQFGEHHTAATLHAFVNF